MLGRHLPTGSRRHPDHERHAHLAPAHVPQKRRVVHDLVEREQAEVDGHHLDDRPQARDRRPDAGANERRLRERRIANPFLAKLREQPLAAGVGAAVPAHVLPHQEHAVVG